MHRKQEPPRMVLSTKNGLNRIWIKPFFCHAKNCLLEMLWGFIISSMIQTQPSFSAIYPFLVKWYSSSCFQDDSWNSIYLHISRRIIVRANGRKGCTKVILYQIDIYFSSLKSRYCLSLKKNTWCWRSCCFKVEI